MVVAKNPHPGSGGGKPKRSSDRQAKFANRLADMVTRHQNNMIRRAVLRGQSVPLRWLTPSFWWLRRCGWAGKEFEPHFEEIWAWWKGLDITAQYALMRASRGRDFDGK